MFVCIGAVTKKQRRKDRLMGHWTAAENESYLRFL
jgi:hypothetical protein